MTERTICLHLAVSILAVISFILLALATFSAPMSTELYFLRSSQAGGVRFGAWGWCLEGTGTCMAPMKLGYTYKRALDAPITGALVLYPIAWILNAFLLLSLVIRVLRPGASIGRRLVCALAVSTFSVSLLAFIFMITTFEPARKRFALDGFSAQLGPLCWLSLVATLLLGLAAMLLLFANFDEDSDVPAHFDKEARLTSPPYRRRLRPFRTVATTRY